MGSSAGTVPADDDVLYVNTEGTFGVSSAGYWWSRLAALLLRVIYVLPQADHPAHTLLFSDDGFITRVGPAFHKTILLVFLIVEIFSVPLSWKKVEGGLEVDWVGYWISIEVFKIGVLQKRQAWALVWCQKMASSEVVLVRSLREGLETLIFLAASGKTLLGADALVDLSLPSWGFRADAADREPHTALVTSTSQQRCSEGLRGKEVCCWRGLREQAPWAFEAGDPFRVIASLELLAGIVEIALATDSQINEALQREGTTTKFPLCLNSDGTRGTALGSRPFARSPLAPQRSQY